MFNVSGFGTSVNILASVTYPIGLQITQFADNSDPVDVPSLQIGDVAMGLNGDLITWSKANPIKVTISVVAFSENDIALSILVAANRVGRGKISARDVITMVVSYPPESNRTPTTLINGIITSGVPLAPVSSDGRLKTRSYEFSFESYVGV